MTDDETRTESQEVGLPDPPAYSIDVRDGSIYEDSGAYGIMYAGDYEWDNVRCTAEAYGEYDPTAHPADRRKTIKGKPRRSLKFHTEWIDVDTAKECVRQIGRYNRFDAEKVSAAFDDMPANIRVVVARESSPAIYVWTDDPVTVMDAINGLEADPAEIYDAIRHRETAGHVACPPDELGGHPNADSYPSLGVGLAREELEEGTPTLVRMWWD